VRSRYRLRSLGLSVAIGAMGAGGAFAQPGPANGPAGDTVAWTVSTPDGDGVKRGGRVLLTLHGAVRPGWHVYGLDQAPTGPTPLQITVEPSEVAKADGAPKGSAPVKKRDPAFGLDTAFYAEAFTVTAPVRIVAQAAAGRQQIPVRVRFQTCNGDICQPPKTVRLSAPVNIRADG
jgi:hypothetical protein